MQQENSESRLSIRERVAHAVRELPKRVGGFGAVLAALFNGFRGRIARLLEAARPKTRGAWFVRLAPTPGQPLKPKSARSLMRARPSRHETRPAEQINWVPAGDDDLLDELFLRVRSQLLSPAPRDEVSGRAPRRVIPGQIPVRRAGVLQGDRRFFYLQSLNLDGWLFERAPGGWIVSRASHVVAQDLFVRQGEAWDAVLVHVAEPTAGGKTPGGLPRISSRRFGGTLMAFPVYEQRLTAAIAESMSRETEQRDERGLPTS